jgi:hypothetical protein
MPDAAPQASSRIFISYRREDSSGHVLALLPALRRHFGSDRIFKDTDNIPPGVDFVKFIRRELESCSVLLAIIGREWLTIQDPRSKRARLQNPDDFLRVEVGTALKNENIRVIPVLVERSSMPAAEDLPPDLTDLAYRNAVELSDGRWDSDVQLLIQAVERATAAADAPAITVHRPELVDLQKRRVREIAAQVNEAREAFEAQDYEATLWACEKALVLDPQQADALEILDRARKAIDEQKIAGWLTEAQQLLNEGDTGGASDLIDQALSLDHNSEAALNLRKEMLALRRERERERERTRALRAATERARSCLDHEDFEEAVRHADDALALDGQAVEAQEIRSKALAALDARRRQREQRRRAQQAVADARARFSAGQRDAALQLLRDFSPPHDLVSEALSELEARVDAATSVHARVDDLIARATATLEAEQIDAAIALLAEAHGLDPGRSQIAALFKEAKERRVAAAAAARARDEANRMLLDASAKLTERDYAGARQLVENARGRDPQHPDIAAWLRRIQDAIDAEAEAVRRQGAIRAAVAQASQSLDNNELEQAIRHAEAALALDDTRRDAREIRDRAAAALAELRTRKEQERRAAEVTARAQSLFDAREYTAAIRLLEGFQPPHALVSQSLDDLRQKFRQVEERRRQEQEEAARQRREQLEAERARAAAAQAAEQKRLADEREQRERERAAREAEEQARVQRAREERERQEAEERRRTEETVRARVQALVAEAESQFAANAFKAARRSAEAALKLAPNHETARAIAAAATQRLHEATPEFWSTRHIRTAAALAVIVVGTSTGFWYYSQSRRAPAVSPPVSTEDRVAAPGTPPAAAPSSAAPPPSQDRPATPQDQPPAPAVEVKTREAGTTAGSTAAPPKGPSPEEEREQRLEQLRVTARGQLTRGQHAQALNSIEQGLSIDSGDRALRSLLDEVTTEAQQASDRSKVKARSVNAHTLAPTTFSQALELEDEAVRFQQSDRKDMAARTFWRAAARFNLAAQQAPSIAQRLQQQRDEEARRKVGEDQPKAPAGETATGTTSGRGTGAPASPEERKAAEHRPPAVTPPAPSPPAPRPPSRGEEAQRIEALLRRYEAAHDSLDVDALRAVFPAVDPGIVKALRSYEYYRMDLVCREPKLSNDLTSAYVECDSSHWFKPRGVKEQIFRGQQAFTFQKRNDGWVIIQVVNQKR